MSQEFITHDGADANGIRAEVVVVKGRGKVTDVTLGNKDRSVQVSFMEENLKNPIKGWANVGTPIHEAVLKAKESGEDVNYRIEIQRKSFIPRDMPMEEVRPKGDMITANKNAIRILASVNDVVSDEAVTHPSEDVAPTYGRHKATGTEGKPATSGGTIDPSNILEGLKALAGTGATHDVQASALGAAIALGVNPADALAVVSSQETSSEDRPPVRVNFSGEGKPWEWYNTDGRENLGHARFASGSGAESFVREQLVALGLDNATLHDGVVYFTNIILSIADRVQEKIYGEGYRPDRASASHARIRGIIYDTVEHYHVLPVNIPANEDANTVVKAWIAEVGNEVFERFQIVLNSSNAPTNFAIPLPESIYGVQPAQTAQKTSKKASKSTVKVEATDTPAVVENVSSDVTEPAEVVVEEVEQVTETPVVESDIQVVPDKEVDEVELAIFAPVDVEALPEEEKNELASEETVAYFRQLIEEANIPDSDLKLVANLLRKTFGKNYSKAQQLPESVLTDFIDFYAGAGEENLRRVIQNS